MTYRVEDTALERVFELLAEEGFDGMSQALEVLLNEIMKVERSRHLQAAPYERSDQRRGKVMLLDHPHYLEEPKSRCASLVES